MHKLYEYVCDELKSLEKKAERGNMSLQEIQYADTLAHLKKNLMKADEMMEDEYGEYSMAYYPMTSYAEEGGGRGRGGNRGGRNNRSSYGYAGARRRDSMGRYSRDGYSMDGGMIEDLRSLMEEAPDEQTKREFQKFIEKMERM